MKDRYRSYFSQFASRHSYTFLPYHLWHAPKDAIEPSATHPLKPAVSMYFIDSNSTTAKNIYDENNVLLGKLSAIGGRIPLLEIYSDDPELRARIQGNITAEVMLEFYNDYLQWIPIGARLNTGRYFADPMQRTLNEIARRNLDLSFIGTELKYLLIEFTRYIEAYNKRPDVLSFPFLSMDDMKAFITIFDVYKGMTAGCSAAVFSDKNGEKTTDTEVRNLDWDLLGKLANFTLVTMTRTRHKDKNKPQAVFSFGLTPGILGISVANDRGLVITINEATKDNTKRENDRPGAVPQFILTPELIENCSTVEEVKAYLQTRQPATSHILTVMDAQGNKGVFEMLPNRGDYAKELFNFREEQHRGVVVSNHFVNIAGVAIPETECIGDSVERFNKMNKAVDSKLSPEEIAKSSSVKGTLHTLIFKHEHENGKNTLRLSAYVANGFSGHAKKEDYLSINLTELFSDFLNTKVSNDDQNSPKQEDIVINISKLKQDDGRVLELIKNAELEKNRSHVARHVGTAAGAVVGADIFASLMQEGVSSSIAYRMLTTLFDVITAYPKASLAFGAASTLAYVWKNGMPTFFSHQSPTEAKAASPSVETSPTISRR